MDKQKQQGQDCRQMPLASSSMESMDITGLVEAMFAGADCEAVLSTVRPPLPASAAADCGGKHVVDGGHGGSDSTEGGSGSGNDPSGDPVEKAKNLPDASARTMLHTRRDKLKEKLRELRQLISADAKMDRASVLDAAISYVKILQQQLMSGTCNLCHSRLHMQSATMQCPAQMPQPMATYATANVYQQPPGAFPFVHSMPVRGMVPLQLQMQPFHSLLSSFPTPGGILPFPTAPAVASEGESSKSEDKSDKPATSTTGQ